jgi:hypothetical protein
MKTKKCTKCGIEKPLTEFSKDKNRKDGRRSHCKACIAQYNAKPENKKRKAERHALYYAENKEKIAQYYEENKEKILTRGAQYYAENKEKITQYREERKAEQPSCVYQIKNLINNKVYIGETTRGELRWKQHLRCLRGNYHENKLLQEDFDKYGEEAFEWTILKEFGGDDKDALILEEARTIQQYIQDGVELYNLMLTIEQLKMLEENKDIE